MKIALAMLLAASAAAPQSPNPASRLQVYSGAQQLCLYRILANREIAANMAVLRASPSKTCECAALLTVSTMSDEMINEVFEHPERDSVPDLGQNLKRCIAMSD